MENQEFDDLVHRAFHETQDANDHYMTTLGVVNCERWHYDQGTGKVTFLQGGRAKFVCDFEVAGTISTVNNTWLWSWENETINPQLSQLAQKVRQIGKERGWNKLTDNLWHADENDGWEMASLMNKIMGGQGVYRIPDENGFMFLVFTKITPIS